MSKRLLLNKTNQAKVNFANFCLNYPHCVFPNLLGELCQLVERRAAMARKAADTTQTQESLRKCDKKDEALRNRIIGLGQQMRMEIEFPSCYPSVKINGKDVQLPLN